MNPIGSVRYVIFFWFLSNFLWSFVLFFFNWPLCMDRGFHPTELHNSVAPKKHTISIWNNEYNITTKSRVDENLTLHQCTNIGPNNNTCINVKYGLDEYALALWFTCSQKVLNYFSNISTLSVPDERYSRNVSCALNLISTFSL